MSFKKGDKVRLTGKEWGTISQRKSWIGKVVKITGVLGGIARFEKGGYEWNVYEVHDKDRGDEGFDDWGAELVDINPGVLTKVEDSHLEDWSSEPPQPKFKVGDVVRVKNVNAQAWADGLVYTISEVVSDRPIAEAFDREHPEWYQIYYDGLSSGHYAGPDHKNTAAIWEENLVPHLPTDDQENLIALSKWIDAGNEHRDPEAITWGRLAKIMEEGGEVIEAYIGLTGQNPRKGATHSREDVLDELLDVAITALGAYEHLDEHRGESIRELGLKLTKIVERAGINA